MSRSVKEVNQKLEAQAPALYETLSPLGRRAFYPPDIPVQAQQAKDATYNGTIGIFTDGRGSAVPLPSLDEVVKLEGDDRNRAFLYSPVSGLPELRHAWREWQRAGVDEAIPSGLPFVTDGLAHGLSLIADLFGGEGRKVAVSTPFWGNYRQCFGLRTGAEMTTAPSYQGDAFDPRALARALEGVPAGEPAVALLNFPSNPGGYSPTAGERGELRSVLVDLARERPLVVVVDDAYAGLAYEDSTPQASFFWELIGAHERLVPVKVDGATKEFFFFGGRVGFLTFGYEPQSDVARAIDNKLSCLLRSTVGSPVAMSQVMMLRALRSGSIRGEIDRNLRIARERYDVIKPLLEKLDRRILRPLPFNAGYFVLIELPEELGLDAEKVRLHLLEEHSTGIIALAGRYLRLAICSVAAEDLPEMVARMERGVRELLNLSQQAGGFRPLV